jgi:hypothetical protein
MVGEIENMDRPPYLAEHPNMEGNVEACRASDLFYSRLDLIRDRGGHRLGRYSRFIRIHPLGTSSAIVYLRRSTPSGAAVRLRPRVIFEPESPAVHLIAAPADLQMFFKEKKNIVFGSADIRPLAGSLALFPAGGFGDFKVAQLVRAMN